MIFVLFWLESNFVFQRVIEYICEIIFPLYSRSLNNVILFNVFL